ncbi:putative epoxide hydrolase [Podospora fimiseda]|uniref:Epoxide hydrolase n=1 Tax=Podospora fimiseda TaxID=252190 RepID=A0AAN7BLT1_9PEZI|nr:putative epoxide hydrolase [Podospora fimiseda]
MAPDKLTPTDPRVTHHTIQLPPSRNSRTYHYLLASPSSSPPLGTVLLIHGFPDLSFGWRYQIPHLLSLNLRVIIPDMLGYGRSSSPSNSSFYSFKSICDDLASLLTVINEPQVIIGGHDWGGAVVWRMCLWYPSVIKAVFSVCTPYTPPNPQFMDKKTIVEHVLPNFGYQLQFEALDLENKIMSQGRDGIRKFLSCLYGAKVKETGKSAMTGEKGIELELFDGEQIGKSPLVSDEELEFYVSEYERNGIHGPLNWYRTWEVNFQEERELINEGRLKISQPALIVTASRDIALPPAMAAGMDKWVERLMRRGVEASHWAIWEKPEEVNGYIEEFLKEVLGEKKVKASI